MHTKYFHKYMVQTSRVAVGPRRARRASRDPCVKAATHAQAAPVDTQTVPTCGSSDEMILLSLNRTVLPLPWALPYCDFLHITPETRKCRGPPPKPHTPKSISGQRTAGCCMRSSDTPLIREHTGDHILTTKD